VFLSNDVRVLGVSCSAPGNGENSIGSYSSLAEKSAVVYDCVAGHYFPLGANKTITCLATGQFDYDPPDCLRMSFSTFF